MAKKKASEKKKPQTAADKGKANKKSTGAASSKKAGTKKENTKPQKIEELVVEESVAMTVDMPLEEHDLVIVARELETNLALKDQLTEALKKITKEKKGEISTVETKIDELRKIVSTGKKKAVVQAGKVRNWMTTMVMFIKKDADPNNLKPEDIYKQEPFGEWDYQLKIRMENGDAEVNDESLKSGEGMFASMNNAHDTSEETEDVDASEVEETNEETTD